MTAGVSGSLPQDDEDTSRDCASGSSGLGTSGDADSKHASIPSALKPPVAEVSQNQKHPLKRLKTRHIPTFKCSSLTANKLRVKTADRVQDTALNTLEIQTEAADVKARKSTDAAARTRAVADTARLRGTVVAVAQAACEVTALV